MTALQSVGVIGAGAWGTALATVAARAGRSVILWARNAEHATRMASMRDNPRLPGVPLAPDIVVTNDLALAARADMLLIATPAQHLRGAVNMLASHLAKPVPIVACAKGIEHGTHKFMTDVIAEAAPHAQPAILSGPSFAELARLGRALGARRETLSGLSGLGDLILTCSSPQSRNFALGLSLGRGEQPPAGKLAEGEFTAPVLIELAASQRVEMPVSEAVASILSGKSTIDAAISALMTRPFKSEE